jgi:hypothetical protein
MMRSNVATLVASLSITCLIEAAPPATTYLEPSGGQAGQTMEVSLGGNPSWPAQIWVDEPKLKIIPDKSKSKLSVSIPKDLAVGVYWLRLFNEDGASTPRPFIVDNLPEIMEVEPNEDRSRAQRLKAPAQVINGRLKSRDVDLYHLNLKQGQTLVASMTANEILGSPIDTHLQLLNVDGHVLHEQNDANGLDPRIVFQIQRDGEYYLRTFAFPAAPDSTIGFSGNDAAIYRLTVTTEGFVDYPFPLAIQAKKPQLIQFNGWNLPKELQSRTIQADQMMDRFPLGSTGNARGLFVRVENHACKVATAPIETIVLPTTISGKLLGQNEVQRFEWNAKKGERWLFQLEANSLGSELEGILKITDSQGKRLAEVDDTGTNPDPELNFTVPADGKYRLEVRDLYRHGSLRHFYRLRIVTPQPDFILSTAAEPPLSTSGTVEFPIQIQRKNGFAEAITFKVEGLPEGVTATFDPATVSDAKVNSVKIKISSPSKPFSGPIRILGESKITSDSKHMTTWPVPNLKTNFDSIWIAIKPTPMKK